MASALFAARVESLSGPIGVASAGTLAGQGAIPTSPPLEVVEVMRPYGIDLRDHRSQALTADLVQSADLVIGMSKRHVQEAILLDSTSWPRSFMLKELVRRGESVGPRQPGQAVDEWLDQVHAGRTRSGLVGRSTVDEEADPYGGELADYRATARELSQLSARVVEQLWPGGPQAAEPGRATG
jgi:protein-tyrosine phosphatase